MAGGDIDDQAAAGIGACVDGGAVDRGYGVDDGQAEPGAVLGGAISSKVSASSRSSSRGPVGATRADRLCPDAARAAVVI